MHPFARLAAATLILPFIVAGCASTTVEITGTPLQQPLCRPQDAPRSVAVYWQPRWRADQKEPAVREALARRGIEQFLAQSRCLVTAELTRLPDDTGIPSDQELVRRAAKAPQPVDRLIHIVVRELGPRLLIGLPVIVEGGTEVVVEVRVLNAATSASLADTRTQWRHGGTFVIKGIGSLDSDLSAALRATLLPEVPAR